MLCWPYYRHYLITVHFPRGLDVAENTGNYHGHWWYALHQWHRFPIHGLSWGMACGFLAALCFALLVVSVKKSKGIPNVIFAASQLLIAGFVVSIVTITAHEGPVVLDSLAILYILIIGVFNSGFACLLYFGSVQMLPAQTVSICGYIEPLSALAFSIIFLGETLTVLQWSGAALVLGGLFIAEFWKSQRLRNRVIE